MIYESKLRSYRDLPVRLAELGTMYRYERSGVLSGLSRVRCMTLNDAHIFCTPDQIKEEFSNVMKLVEQSYQATLGITKYSYRLSLRDPANKEKYVDNDEMWELGERVLREALDSPGTALQGGPRRGGILRAEARHPACRRDGPRGDLLDDPGRFPPAQPVRA